MAEQEFLGVDQHPAEVLDAPGGSLSTAVRCLAAAASSVGLGSRLRATM